jgi:putative phosphoesterase
MKIGLLSDIHSNCYALLSVVRDMEEKGIDRIILLGDTFGYYPWASESYRILSPYLATALEIKGNHDQLVLDETPPVPIPSYWTAAKSNQVDLDAHAPAALDWLRHLKYDRRETLHGISIRMVHGTPADPADGRFYPDNSNLYDWMPAEDEVVLMGHTHYPLHKTLASGGVIFNPGSVGQPRDHNPMPSWGILDTNGPTFSHIRSKYDNVAAMEALRRMKWNENFIASLNKSK